MKKRVSVYTIVSILIIVAIDIVAILLSDVKSFWTDELISIGFVNNGKGFFDIINFYFNEEVTNLPLYSLLLWPWYNIMPYGQVYLYLLNIILADIGMIFLYEIGKKISGERLGMIIIIMCIMSYFFIDIAVLELRAYSLLFMMMCIVLYFYLDRSTKSKNIRYVVALVFLTFTHYMGIFFIFLIGVYDLVLCIRKKQRFMLFIDYLIPFCLFLPWATKCIITSKISVLKFWVEIPDYAIFFDILKQVCVCSNILTLAFIIYSIILIVFKIKRKNDDKISSFLIINIIIPIIMLVSVFIYSRYINSEGGFFLNRYFVSILPSCYIIIGHLINTLIELCITKKILIRIIIVISLVVTIYEIAVNNYYYYYYYINGEDYWDYRGLAEKISTIDELYDNDNAIFCMQDMDALIYGFFDYYFVRKGIAMPDNFLLINRWYGDEKNFETIYSFVDFGGNPSKYETEEFKEYKFTEIYFDVIKRFEKIK